MRAKKLAEEKMCDSFEWWAAFDLAVDDYRRYALLYVVLNNWHLDMIGRDGVHPRTMSLVRDQIGWAHDMMLLSRERMDTCSNCASSSEIAARIYYEEHEERERG